MGDGRLIDYPEDERTVEEAAACGLPEPVIIRDIVRIVEVLNLDAKRFFNKRSVLAGSMALRSFGSPRFTVYDADFSTSAETVSPPTNMKSLLAYQDPLLEITPTDLVPHDSEGTAWKSAPVTFAPVFTSLVPDDGERTFKADISFRGMLLDGIERPLGVPYDLGLWTDPPIVVVMDPHETIAEKVLGWCVHRLVKHYADLAFIAIVAQSRATGLVLSDSLLRSTLHDKLVVMKGLQGDYYDRFADVDAVIDALAEQPTFPTKQWQQIMYVRQHRDRYTPDLLVRAVQELLIPRLR